MFVYASLLLVGTLTLVLDPVSAVDLLSLIGLYSGRRKRALIVERSRLRQTEWLWSRDECRDLCGRGLCVHMLRESRQKRKKDRAVVTDLRYVIIVENHLRLGCISRLEQGRSYCLLDAYGSCKRELPSDRRIMSEEQHVFGLRGAQAQRHTNQANVVREFIDRHQRDERTIIPLDEELEHRGQR